MISLLFLLACAPLPSKDEVFDPDGDGVGWGEDCDNATAYAEEEPYTGVDEDCDDTTPDDDLDNDGYGIADDCDDQDPALTPSATDQSGDGVDQNCDGLDGVDADGDGFASIASGGVDCDDGEAASNPGNTEIIYNGLDDDCDPSTDDDDLDGDGHTHDSDCDDTNETVYPDAPELCDDGLINACGATAAEALAECGRVGDLTLASASAFLRHADANARMGYALAAGDVNDDGAPDLVFGAPLSNASATDGGAAYLLLNEDIASVELTDNASVSYWGSSDYVYGGSALAVLADFDGRGCGDLAIGAPGNGASGAAYVFTDCGGGENRVLEDASVRILDTDSGSLGNSLASVADLNGDGRSELAVGSTAYDDRGNENAGAVYLFSGTGSPGEIDTSDAEAQYVGVSNGAEAGYDVASCDLDGSGVPDLVVGAPNALNSGGVRTGGVYIVPELGSAGTYSLSGFTLLTGEAESDQAGISVDCGADATGDGLDDLLVGAPYYNTGEEGATYLIQGSANLRSGGLVSGDARLTGFERGEEAGISVAFAGDVDGDARSDVLVGARYAGGTNEGRIYVVLATELGGSSGLSGVQMRIAGETSTAYTGWAVASAGDIDGNGLADLLIGAPGASRAYLFNPGY